MAQPEIHAALQYIPTTAFLPPHREPMPSPSPFITQGTTMTLASGMLLLLALSLFTVLARLDPTD